MVKELKKEGASTPVSTDEFMVAQEMIAGVDLIIRDTRGQNAVPMEQNGSTESNKEKESDRAQE